MNGATNVGQDSDPDKMKYVSRKDAKYLEVSSFASLRETHFSLSGNVGGESSAKIGRFPPPLLWVIGGF